MIYVNSPEKVNNANEACFDQELHNQILVLKIELAKYGFDAYKFHLETYTREQKMEAIRILSQQLKYYTNNDVVYLVNKGLYSNLVYHESDSDEILNEKIDKFMDILDQDFRFAVYNIYLDVSSYDTKKLAVEFLNLQLRSCLMYRDYQNLDKELIQQLKMNKQKQIN